MNASGKINNVSLSRSKYILLCAIKITIQKMYVRLYVPNIIILQSLPQPIKTIQEPHTKYSYFDYIK